MKGLQLTLTGSAAEGTLRAHMTKNKLLYPMLVLFFFPLPQLTLQLNEVYEFSQCRLVFVFAYFQAERDTR